MLGTQQSWDSWRPETTEMGVGPLFPESGLGIPELPILKPRHGEKRA